MLSSDVLNDHSNNTWYLSKQTQEMEKKKEPLVWLLEFWVSELFCLLLILNIFNLLSDNVEDNDVIDI